MSKNDKKQINNDGSSSVRSGRVMDFIAKIVCLIAAFGIWFYAMSMDVVTLERDFTVPVKFENESALLERTGWAVLSGKNSNIVVTVKGKRNIVNQLTESDIYAYVDLSDIDSAGRKVLDIKVTAPSECEIINTSVSSISSYIDKRLTKNVPVVVEYKDYVMSSEYQLDDPILNLSEIAITGPESELNKIASAKAELSLGNITQTVNTTSGLSLVDTAGNTVSSSYVTMAAKSVNVTVKLFVVKDVPLKVSYKHGFFNDGNVKISITPSMVTLRGEPSVLEDMTSLNIATLDEKKYISNSTQTVTLDLPNGVIVTGGDSTAVINVEHINTGTKQIAVQNVTLANTGGLDCEIQSETVNLLLRGPYNLLSSIKEEDISIVADMKSYLSGSGMTVVPVTVTFSSDYEGLVYELESYSVTVNIK